MEVDYIKEVELRLRKNLETIKTEGVQFDYWLQNRETFSMLQNKKIFIHRMMMDLCIVDGLRVEKSTAKNGFCIKSKAGQFFYLDIEQKEYAINEDFLEPDYWEDRCNELTKQYNENEYKITILNNDKSMTWTEKIKEGLWTKKKREEKKTELLKKNKALNKRKEIYNIKKERYREVYVLAKKLVVLMEKYEYKMTYI